MYDRTKARTLGLITTCEARLINPVSVSGTYRCTEGHSHAVQWHGQSFTVSKIGYDPAFLGALNRADDAAIVFGDPFGDPETLAYETAYNTALIREGYGAVLA